MHLRTRPGASRASLFRSPRTPIAGSAALALAAAALVPALSVAQPASPVAAATTDAVATSSVASCSRDCMSDIVDQVLQAMVDHDYSAVPTAPLYKATENSHPAALRMMTLFRTVTKADEPSLLAIDTTNGQAYFALAISEGSDEKQNMLWGRIKVVNHKITELELYVNRSRGDHGYIFSAEQLAENYQHLTDLPSDRVKADRATLEKLSQAAFDTDVDFLPELAPDCQFTENGGLVVDPGPDGTGSTEPLGCVFPEQGRPVDKDARDDLVIDEETGIVVVGALIPGEVYGYGTESAFIPNDMTAPQEAQKSWINNKLATDPDATVMQPQEANGETLQVLQYYDGKLQALQINLHVGGPDMGSAWTNEDVDLGSDSTPSITSVAVEDTTFGTAGTAEVAVTDQDGDPADGEVTVSVDGTEVGTTTVADDATASVPLPDDLAVGDHEVTATFSGSGFYSSNASARFNVAEQPTQSKAASTTSLTLAKTAIKQGKKPKVTVTVVTDGAVPTGTVTVYKGGKPVAVKDLKRKHGGTVTVKLPRVWKTGTHTYRAGYGGNSRVLDSQSETVTLTVFD